MSGTLVAAVALAVTAACVQPRQGGEPAGRGSLIIAGGGDLPASILERFVALAGGRGKARILVLPMASGSPESGPEQAEEFRGLGVEARSVALTREQALLPESAAHLRDVTGVWFTGGDQSRVTAAIGETPFEEALLRLYRDGAVVGGTSAGAAIMSPIMITGEERPAPGARDGDPLFNDIIRGRVISVRGLGLLPGTIVDQHFVARARHNRLISLVLEHPDQIGVGIDERTALEVGPDGTWRVLGEGVAVIYDARPARVADSGPLAGAGIKMHVLPPGSTFDPVTGLPTLPPPSSSEPQMEEKAAGERPEAPGRRTRPPENPRDRPPLDWMAARD